MNTYPLTISTPDGRVFSGEAQGLFVRAALGDIAILAGHIPLMTTVRPGQCRIRLPEGQERKATIAGGLLTVGREGTILMTQEWHEEPSKDR